MNINNVLGFGLSIQKSNQKLVLVFKLYTLSHMFLILVISNTSIQYFFHSQCNNRFNSILSSCVNYKSLLFAKVATSFSGFLLKEYSSRNKMESRLNLPLQV